MQLDAVFLRCNAGLNLKNKIMYKVKTIEVQNEKIKHGRNKYSLKSFFALVSSPHCVIQLV